MSLEISEPIEISKGVEISTVVEILYIRKLMMYNHHCWIELDPRG